MEMTKYLFQYTYNEEQKQYFTSSANALSTLIDILSCNHCKYEVINKEKNGFAVYVICNHNNFVWIWRVVESFNFNTMVSTIIDDNCGWNGDILDE